MHRPKYANEATVRSGKPVSAEVAQFAERLATRAGFAERTNGKPILVMTSETPRSCEVLSKDGQEVPPLFADLRGNFVAIAGALDSIEYALPRTEF